MKDSLILEGKIYISARRAAKIINYAQDYIGQLCRAGKLDCKMVGRSWFVTEESLLAHRENAVDSTQERVLKIIKNNDAEIKATIQEKIAEKTAPQVAPIVSPIVVTPSNFKYEVEKKSLLPELTKKVPTPFVLPKPVMNASQFPFVKKQSSKTAALRDTRLTGVLVTVCILVSGFAFMSSLSYVNNGASRSQEVAVVASSARDLFEKILESFGFAPKAAPYLATQSAPALTPPTPSSQNASTSSFNGIAVVPGSTSAADEVEKAKLRNSFSDEVNVKADESGTAGVITPVFKKTGGNDFVYVLVPVKDREKDAKKPTQP